MNMFSQKEMKYEILINKFGKKVSKGNFKVFNSIKFKIQALQFIYIIEEYLNNFLVNKVTKTFTIADLFAGTGIFSYLLIKIFSKKVKTIYALEKENFSFKLLKNVAKSFGGKNQIIPIKIESNSHFNPYKSKMLEGKKFDFFVANPPYVPLPQSHFRYYNSFINGGNLGISAITELLKGLSKYGNEEHIFACLSYSISGKNINEGSIICGSLPIDGIPTQYRNEYSVYKKILNNLKKMYNLKFYILNPPAWVGFDRNYNKVFIPMKRYYEYIFMSKTDLDLINHYINNFDKKYRYLYNILIVGEKRKDLSKTSCYIVRNLNLSDLHNVIKVEQKSWPSYLQANKSNLYSRIKYFSEGTVGIFTLSGKLIGFATSQIINFTPYTQIDLIPNEKWMDLDTFPNANLLTTSDKNGNALHLVSGCVLPEYRNRGIWSDLIIFRLRLAKMLNLKYVVILSRLNYPIKNSTKEAILNYLDKESNNDIYIKKLLKFGFKVNGIKRVEKDKRSGGFWILLYKNLA